MMRILEMTTQIVSAHASASPISSDELEDALRRIHRTLLELRAKEDGVEFVKKDASEDAPGMEDSALDPKDSIKEDHVVCLECGAQFRQITANHLRSHGLTPREYKKKWGFRMKDSLAAKELTRSRSAAAKKRGIPEKLRQFLDERKRARS